MSAPPKNGKSARQLKSFRLDELTLRKLDRFRLMAGPISHDKEGQPVYMSESDAIIKMLEKFEPRK